MAIVNLNYISRIEWLSHYEFIVAGSNSGNHYYSLMDMRNECFPVHDGNIAAMKKKEILIFTGRFNGSIGFWDFRKKEIELKMQHYQGTKHSQLRTLK